MITERKTGQVDARLSDRMLCVTRMLGKRKVVCDIGCDHAFVSIYLIQKNLAHKVLACDVRPGPLEGAKRNIRKFHCQEQIEVRLSDGFQAVKEHEADGAIIAGMGGPLMQKIILGGAHVITPGFEMVVQPQSELKEFRIFLREQGFSIVKEEMLVEEGKYYTALFVRKEDEMTQADEMTQTDGAQQSDESRQADEMREIAQDAADAYGGFLIAQRSEVLRDYLLKKRKKMQGVLQKLGDTDNEERIEEVTYDLKVMDYILSQYET